MPIYYYKAVDAQGETLEGRLEAGEELVAVAKLQEAGYLPIQVSPAGSGQRRGREFFPSRNRISRKEVGIFTQELAILLGAGLPLDHSLQTLLELADEPRLRRLVADIHERVRGGAGFSAALEAQPGVFSRLYINTVRAGEAGGALDVTLKRLADYLQRMKALRDSVVSAMIYPAILVAVAGISVIVLLTFVVPQFTQMFQDTGGALPLPTQIVITLGELLRGYWWAPLALGIVLTLYLRRQLSEPVSRLRWDQRLLGLPLVGDLLAKVEVARLSRTLGVLLGNGVPLLSALAIGKDVLNNRILAEAVAAAGAGLQAGQGLSGPLAVSGVFPKLAVQMIKVGEESGQLEEMLMRVADVYDQEVKTAVQRLLALLEPVLIVGLGAVIAAIIVSILLAILSVNELVF